MKRVEERIEQVREECKGDVEKFCKASNPEPAASCPA